MFDTHAGSRAAAARRWRSGLSGHISSNSLLDLQVAEVQRPEAPEPQMHAGGPRVVAEILRLALEFRAVRIRLAGARQRFGGHFARRGHDPHVDAAQRHGVSRRDHRPAGRAVTARDRARR